MRTRGLSLANNLRRPAERPSLPADGPVDWPDRRLCSRSLNPRHPALHRFDSLKLRGSAKDWALGSAESAALPGLVPYSERREGRCG